MTRVVNLLTNPLTAHLVTPKGPVPIALRFADPWRPGDVWTFHGDPGKGESWTVVFTVPDGDRDHVMREVNRALAPHGFAVSPEVAS